MSQSTTPQLPLNLGHRPALGRDDLLVTSANKDAVTWIDRWPDWPGHALGLYGPAGSGKTHLAHVFARLSQAHVLSSTTLGQDDPVSVAAHHPTVVVDHAGEEVPEQALLHLYNAVREAKGHILLVSRESPARWSIDLPDLQSRLKGMVTVKIHPPDDATIGAVMLKLFRDRQISVSDEVVAYAVMRMPRTFSAARTLVDVVDREALAQNRRITVPFIRTILSNPTLFPSTDE